MKTTILKYLPFIVLLAVIIGYLGYLLIYIYKAEDEAADDFLITYGKEINNKFKIWYLERMADLSFFSKLHEIPKLLTLKYYVSRSSDSLSVLKKIDVSAKSHQFDNFWILDSLGNNVLSYNLDFNFPKKFLDGTTFSEKFQIYSETQNTQFIELAANEDFKPVLFLVSKFKLSGDKKYKVFYFVAAFSFDFVVERVVSTFWSRYEIVEVTFAYPNDKQVLLLWNFPERLNSILTLNKIDKIVKWANEENCNKILGQVSFNRKEKAIGFVDKLFNSNIYFSVKIFKSKIFARFLLTTIVFGFSLVLFSIILFIGTKYIRKRTNEKILILEKEYLQNTLALKRKYELFIQNANDLILVCNKDNQIVEVNHKVIEILGPAEKLIYKPITEFMSTDDIEKIEFFIKAEKGIFPIKLQPLNKEPISCYVSVNKVNIDGEEFYFYIIQDISELIQKSRKIEKLNLFLNSISKVNHIILMKYELGEIFSRSCDVFVNVGQFKSAMFLKYLDGIDEYIVFSNSGEKIVDIFGEEIPARELYKKLPIVEEAVLSKSITFVNDLQSFGKMTPEIAELIGKGFKSIVVIPIVHNDNVFGLFLVGSNQTNLFDQESLLILEEMKSDISFALDDYYREIRLSESEFKKELFFDRAPNGFILTDVTGKIDNANRSFAKMVGMGLNEICSKTIFNIFPNNTEQIKNMFNTLNEGIVQQLEIPYDMNGESKWFLLVGELIEEINYYLFVCSDITDQKKYQFELEKQRQKAIELEKLKSFILQNISHEFRTPLNGILGFTKVLKESVQEDDLKEFCELIYESGYRLYRTLESLIFTSQIVSGMVKPRKELIDLRMFFENLYQELKNLYRKSKLNFDLKVECDECFAHTDSEFISVIIYSLVDNAVKFTKEGKVEIRVKEIEEEGPNKFLIEVQDTGIGIQSEMRTKIFDLFAQGSEGLAREYEGLGIGLFNAKMLVELLGGKLDFESEVGKGTTFRVII